MLVEFYRKGEENVHWDVLIDDSGFVVRKPRSQRRVSWRCGQQACTPKIHEYTEAELHAAIAEVERQKADISPMIRLTQHRLDVLLEDASLKPMPLPVELQTSGA